MAERARSPGQTGRRWSFALVRIAGVTVRVHVTFLVLVALVAVTAEESVAAAIGWLIVLFACVVVHEFAHALVARSKGIEVHEIDLLPIGGISRLERMPEDWRDESAIAVAGPAASVLIALLAFAFAATSGLALLPVRMWEGPLVVRLAWVNLMLAAFNLLPAFPLDGGRVLRALLERRRSRVAATHQAALISRGIATALIAIGLLVNFWLLMIGVFIMLAGNAEETAALIHAALGPGRAFLLAMPSPATLPAGMSALEANRLAADNPQPAYVVVDPSGETVGVLEAAALRRAPPSTLVRDLARGGSVDADVSLEQVAGALADGPVAVTSGGRVIGVITEASLTSYLEQRLREVRT